MTRRRGPALRRRHRRRCRDRGPTPRDRTGRTHRLAVDVLTTTARDATTSANDFEIGSSLDGVGVHRFPVERAHQVISIGSAPACSTGPDRLRPPSRPPGWRSRSMLACACRGDRGDRGRRRCVPSISLLPDRCRAAARYAACRAASGRARRATDPVAALRRDVRRPPPGSSTGAKPSGGSQNVCSRWRAVHSSSSASASSPDPAIPRWRAPRSASADADRSSCASGASTTARGSAPRRVLHAVQRTAPERPQARVRGPGGGRAPPHPDIVIVGRVEEDVKWGLLRAARALVSPSAYESFSIVLLEAWSVDTPALVNRRSR